MLKELLESDLDEHDALILACVSGELGVREFLAVYDCFYPRWPLDGHEGHQDLLKSYESRIEVHRRVWERIECRMTTEEHASNPAFRAKGFIGEREALKRLEDIAREGGLLEPQ